jgi:AcrR family transcriptional regulator
MTDTDIVETREAPLAPPARRPLTRASILDAGLRLIDQQGLEALTMRRLAQELGVDPMSIYRHFENKDALLDGVANVLWGEVDVPGGDVGWEALLRSIATSLRALAHAHPHAYALLLNRQILPLAMLRVWDVAMERLQQAGFERQRAREIACAVCSYASGYAMVELSCAVCSDASGDAMEEVPAPWLEPSERAAEGMADIGRLTQVMRCLPRETPARLVEVAYVLTNCDTDAQFTFGLDLMLTGLKARPQ